MSANKVVLTKEQVQLLKSLNLPYDWSNLSDEEILKIDDVVSDEMMRHGINDKVDGLTDYGELCVDILSDLAELP